MTFKSGASFDRGRASTGKRGRGAAVAGGGLGVGGLLLVGLFVLLGGNPQQAGELLQGSQNQWQNEITAGEDTGEDAFEHCFSGGDAANQYADCRVIMTAQSVDDFWIDALPAQAGIEYTQSGLVVFEDSVQSGCGYASAATGPFYCGGDQTSYFDVSFFNQLDQLGGTNAPLAQMYIVAHEFGHHIQFLEGTLGHIDYNNPGEDSLAVQMELQADCYAGMWVGQADKGEDAMLEPITPEQVSAAVDTARAVGDDNIQRRSGGEVQPDLWTHGSSEQRSQAFLTGYEQGTMEACNYPGLKTYSS